MDQALKDLRPEPNDLVVIPMDFEVPKGVPFLVHKMKFLLSPSIIKSGSNNMSFFENMSTSKIWEWLTGNSQDPRVQVNLRKKVDESSKEEDARGYSEATYDYPKFYRYSRPLDTHPNNPNVLGPKGGLTFYIELDAPNKTFAFSYSLCHHNDRFNKAVSRHICKQRFENGDWYEVANYDTNLGVMLNIRIAINVLLSGIDTSIIESEQLIHFSSVSDRLNKHELNMIFERI